MADAAGQRVNQLINLSINKLILNQLLRSCSSGTKKGNFLKWCAISASFNTIGSKRFLHGCLPFKEKKENHPLFNVSMDCDLYTTFAKHANIFFSTYPINYLGYFRLFDNGSNMVQRPLKLYWNIIRTVSPSYVRSPVFHSVYRIKLNLANRITIKKRKKNCQHIEIPWTRLHTALQVLQNLCQIILPRLIGDLYITVSTTTVSHKSTF